MNLPFSRRRDLLKSLLAAPDDPLRVSPLLRAPSGEVLEAVRKLGLEGVVGKRIDFIYEPGERSGAWIKHRTNREQEFPSDFSHGTYFGLARWGHAGDGGLAEHGAMFETAAGINLHQLTHSEWLPTDVSGFESRWPDHLQIVTVKHGRFKNWACGSKTVLATGDGGLANAAEQEGLRVWNCLKSPNHQKCVLDSPPRLVASFGVRWASSLNR